MTKPLLDRTQYDHPEHFDDDIREYRTSKRYIPTPLENLLFELSGYKCGICSAPWLEIHHIEELGDGGQTEYENLIVLCPNCHTRVHSQGVPSKEELRHYKLKQEIAYELPVLSRLTTMEREFLSRIAALSQEDQLAFSDLKHGEIATPTQDEAVQLFRKEVGHFHLQESGMVTVDLESAVTLADGQHVSVALRVRLTGKGLKWLRYLRASGRLPT